MRVFGDVLEDEGFESFCLWAYIVPSIIFGVLFFISAFM